MATYEGFSEIRTGVFMEQGQKFRLIRKQRHLTIKQLAEVASSVASISDFENGKTSLSNYS
ncbi:helix-turn-helix domain-containing protein [Streptococcus sp. FT1-106]|uniref:helix-turn-helix domain-containing protein n=1 Tax=Streptococcus sp. FT1-106 TaxID=3409994 RepID=UPI003BF4B8C6